MTNDLSWRSLLSKKRSKILSDIELSKRDTLEGQRAFGVQQEAATGIQGGFTKSETERAKWEYGQATSAATEGLDMEEKLLTEQEKQQNEAIKKAKKLSLVKTIGTGAAIAANFIPGVGPLASAGISAGIGAATNIATDLMGGQADYSNIDWASLSGLSGYLKKRNSPTAAYIPPDYTF